MAGLTTLGPTVRALRTETVSALTDSARRPGRAVLHACNTATTLTMVTGLLVIFAQPVKGCPGSSMANVLRDAQERHVILGTPARDPLTTGSSGQIGVALRWRPWGVGSVRVPSSMMTRPPTRTVLGRPVRVMPS